MKPTFFQEKRVKFWLLSDGDFSPFSPQLLLARLPITPHLEITVTRLGEISPFGQFFMAKFFLEKIAQ